MQFKSFDVKDIEGINSFLKDNGDFIPANGIHYHDGNVCFVYSNINLRKNDSEQEKTKILAHLETKIEEYRMMMVDSDSITIFWRNMVRLDVKDSTKNLLDTIDQRKHQEIQIKALQLVKTEIESGTWNTSTSKVNDVDLDLTK